MKTLSKTMKWLCRFQLAKMQMTENLINTASAVMYIVCCISENSCFKVLLLFPLDCQVQNENIMRNAHQRELVNGDVMLLDL